MATIQRARLGSLFRISLWRELTILVMGVRSLDDGVARWLSDEIINPVRDKSVAVRIICPFVPATRLLELDS